MEGPAIQDTISELEAKLEKLTGETTDNETLKELYLELGDAYQEADESAKAKQLFDRLLTEANEAYYAIAYYELGKIALDENDYAAVEKNFGKAIEWGQKNADEHTTAKAHHAYALLMLQADESTAAESKACLEHITTAIELFSKHKKYENLGKAFTLLTGFTKTRFNTNQAMAYYKQLLADNEAKETNDLLGFIHYHLGMYYEEDDDSKNAFLHFEQALHYKNKLNVTVDLGETYYHLGLLHDEQGNHDKAFEYNVIALRHMLTNFEQSTHISMAVIFVQGGIDDCKNDALKQEAETLLAEAQKLDLLPDAVSNHPEGPQSESDFIYEHSHTGNLLEETITEQKQAEADILDELKLAYAQQKDKLPNDVEDFAQAAYNLLENLESGINRSVFSFLAGKKNKARKAELKQVLQETQDTLKNAQATTENGKASIETWSKKLENEFGE